MMWPCTAVTQWGVSIKCWKPTEDTYR